MGSPTVTPLYEQWHNGGYLVSQAPGHLSHDQVTLGQSGLTYAGTVLGQQSIGTTAAAAALGTNVGNGTVGAITLSSGVQLGAYVVEFDSATNFVVSNPAGAEVGHGTVGNVFNAGGVSFTITAGGTAFAAADSFTVTVAAGSGNYLPLNPTANDGTQTPAAILFETKDTTSAAKTVLATVRSAEVNASELIWPAGTTALQIAAYAAVLAAKGIISR